jgi:hypothetical protein
MDQVLSIALLGTLEPCQVDAKLLYSHMPLDVLGSEVVDVRRLLSQLGAE